MVLYFTSNVVDPPATIYMGKDKYENEELIKYGFDEDFHVDKLSSAHVYLRLREGESWEDIPKAVLNDLAQLVKANSIEGNKKNNITVIYTPWSNLKKTGDMDVGQVSFHNPKLVKRVFIEKRVNEIVNRLNKTKQERYPDLYAERLERDKLKRRDARIALNKQRQEELAVKRERDAAKANSLENLFDITNMKTNRRVDDDDGDVVDEDDFM
ncbi:uncharacterized protein VTP21DRAFT_5007 [Calcarisporiella thermophila]|uniref:uncharacterized protein n=1 Tax=Calcarisporiella thermophila TaxID=911321 RepID=UPI003742C2C5